MNRFLKLYTALLCGMFLLSGCVPPHLSKSELIYQPAGVASVAKVPARVVVAPLEMSPKAKIEIEPPIAEGNDGYLSILPRRFSEWFAQELEHQKGFASVRYSDWDELAKNLENTDIIVTGEIKQLRMTSGFNFMLLPPQSILVLIGLAPAPVIRHEFVLELKAANVTAPDKPFWAQSVSISDPKAGWKFIWQPICKASIRFDDCLFLRQEQLLAPVFKTWVEELVKASSAQNFRK